MTDLAVLCPGLELLRVFIEPLFGMRGRHAVAVVTEILLMTPHAGFFFRAGDFLLVSFHPFTAEGAGLATTESLMTDAACV